MTEKKKTDKKRGDFSAFLFAFSCLKLDFFSDECYTEYNKKSERMNPYGNLF